MQQEIQFECLRAHGNSIFGFRVEKQSASFICASAFQLYGITGGGNTLKSSVFAVLSSRYVAYSSQECILVNELLSIRIDLFSVSLAVIPCLMKPHPGLITWSVEREGFASTYVGCDSAHARTNTDRAITLRGLIQTLHSGRHYSIQTLIHWCLAKYEWEGLGNVISFSQNILFVIFHFYSLSQFGWTINKERSKEQLIKYVDASK